MQRIVTATRRRRSPLTEQGEEAEVGGLATVISRFLLQLVEAPPQVAQEGGLVHGLAAMEGVRQMQVQVQDIMCGVDRWGAAMR